MKTKQEDNLSLPLTIVLWAIIATPLVPAFMSQVIEYEAIPHAHAKETEPAQMGAPSLKLKKPVELRRGETPELLEHLFAEAEKYGANAEQMRQTISCESAYWQTDIQSWHRYPDGSREQSFGLAQIHLPDHPQVSYEEAIDPLYAITFMAQHFGENNGRIWTCHRKLFGNSSSTI